MVAAHLRPGGARSERGAAAVEFALVLPVLMMILMGAIDWGYYFFVQEIVVNSAREGARAGSLCVAGSACATNPNTEAENAVTAYLTNVGFKAPTVTCSSSTPPWVCATELSVTCGSPTGCPSISVSVAYPVGSITGFLSAFLGISMPNATATAVMRM